MESKFEPILFFYEWQLRGSAGTDLNIASGLVTAFNQEQASGMNLIKTIKEDLIANGHPQFHVLNGQLLSIYRA